MRAVLALAMLLALSACGRIIPEGRIPPPASTAPPIAAPRSPVAVPPPVSPPAVTANALAAGVARGPSAATLGLGESDARTALAAFRARLRIPPKVWRIGHTALAVVIVLGTVVHALLIEGTMEPLSKAAFCILVVLATAKVVFDLRVWVLLSRSRRL